MTGPGLDEFFQQAEEILIASTAQDVLEIVRGMPESVGRASGRWSWTS